MIDHPAHTDANAVDEHTPGNSTLSSHTKKRWIVATLLVIALLCIGLLVHVLSKPKAKPTGPPAIPVSLAPVTVGDLDVYLDALGTVTPVYTVTVVSRVAGEIT
jgi:membrane fusion protein, multidrug efflux system